MPQTSVLLADDHVIVAEGIAALLKTNFQLVGMVSNGRALLTGVTELKPDVIVTDISMPLLNGLDAVRQIRAARSNAKIVILTMHVDPEMAVQCFKAGALGYVLKAAAGEELVAAIREVAQGRAYLSSLIAKDLIDVFLEAKNPAKGNEGGVLTVRQRDVLQLVAEGRTMKEVASVLNISQRTAESHKYEIMKALGVTNTAALVQYAMKNKLIS